jgi:hypothetical protein
MLSMHRCGRRRLRNIKQQQQLRLLLLLLLLLRMVRGYRAEQHLR